MKGTLKSVQQRTFSVQLVPTNLAHHILISGPFDNYNLASSCFSSYFQSFSLSARTGRFQFLHVGDLSTRVDTVSATLGQAFIQMSLMGCQQNLVQRYMSLNTERDIQKYAIYRVTCETICKKLYSRFL